MTISAERLAGAMTPEAYIEQLEESREAFEENLAAARFTEEERSRFAGLRRPLTLLVLTEDWCGDSLANLPIAIGLARATGALDVRILKREGNEDIAGRYLLEDGRNHIPTYIVLDDELGEVGHLIERTTAITEAMAAFGREWFAAHPEHGDAGTPIGELSDGARAAFLPDLRAARAEQCDLERREIVEAFARIVERAPAPV